LKRLVSRLVSDSEGAASAAAALSRADQAAASLESGGLKSGGFKSGDLASGGFAAALISWQRKAGRHHLPWQNTTDAYRIWLSEIMLQQTQVAAVIPYYARFLAAFPDVQALAAAPLEAVMQQWSGLGYYSRARNLHACAQRVVTEYGGVFPSDPALIAGLPGIGRSTAAAIAAFAYGKRAAILDGNVKRVLCRVFGIAGYPGQRLIEQRLWQLAEQLLPAKPQDIEVYTQGLMDLGATLCKPRNPECGHCPLRTNCTALAEDSVARLPTPKPRSALPERATTMLVLRHGNAILLEKRPPQGIWGGLWSFPERVHDADDASGEIAVTSLQSLAERHGTIASVDPGDLIVHGFTHFRLRAQPLVVTLTRRNSMLADTIDAHVWMDLPDARRAGLPAPVKKFLASLVDA